MGEMDIHLCSASSASGAPLLEISADYQTIIPYIPTQNPQLGRPVYQMIFAHLLVNDRPVSLAFTYTLI